MGSKSEDHNSLPPPFEKNSNIIVFEIFLLQPLPPGKYFHCLILVKYSKIVPLNTIVDHEQSIDNKLRRHRTGDLHKRCQSFVHQDLYHHIICANLYYTPNNNDLLLPDDRAKASE